MNSNYTPEKIISLLYNSSETIDEDILDEIFSDNSILDAFVEEADKMLAVSKDRKIKDSISNFVIMQYAAGVQYVSIPAKFPFVFNS